MKEKKYLIEASGDISNNMRHTGTHYFDSAEEALTIFYEFMKLPCNTHLVMRLNNEFKSLVCEWGERDRTIFWYYPHDGYKEFRKDIGIDFAREQRALEDRRYNKKYK